MTKYRKKAVDVDAMRMPAEHDQDAVRKVAEWMVDLGYRVDDDLPISMADEQYVYGDLLLPEYGANYLLIETLEGDMTARPGDFIIRGVQGEFYPCKPDIFAATYEALA